MATPTFLSSLDEKVAPTKLDQTAKPNKEAENKPMKDKDLEVGKINEALFRPSEWDDYPLKRDDKHTNKIVQPDFAPFCDAEHPEPLPVGFKFQDCDVRDEACLKRLCTFLNANFMPTLFLFETAHVRWVLDVPTNNFPRAHLVRAGCVFCVVAGDIIAGLIAARPVTYRIDGRVVCSLEVVWMCTLQDVRGKRLAAVMMKELYRRAFTWGIANGMFFVIPRQLPALHTVGPIRMYRRMIAAPPDDNAPLPNKNIDLVRFANLRDVSRMMKIYRKYASDSENTGWRLHRELNRREFEHLFLKRGDVMTYVIRTDRGDVKDFVSLYEMTEQEKNTPRRVAYIHFVSFVNEKLLELFLQNILFILAANKISALYVADTGGVGDTLRSKLQFQEAPTNPGFMYHFNLNTTTISAAQLQLSPTL